MSREPARSGPEPRLPPVWRGRRRRHLVVLTAAGLAQAGCAGLGAQLMLHGLRQAHPRGPGHPALVVTALAATALLAGALRMAERIVTERLSQDYVHEIRIGLLARDLADGPATSLGIAVTRTSNDLTSVRNWVALGIAPLVVGVPLLAGAAAVLLRLGTGIALGFLLPLLLLGLCLALLAGPAYARTREARSARGRLSGLVADTLLASRAVRAGGGSVRELNRIRRRSDDVARASVLRARYAGAQRGAAAAATMLASSGVVVAGVVDGARISTITAALTVVGLLAAPMTDLGRVAEYRQTFRAARRVIAPALQRTGSGAAPATTLAPAPAPGHLRVSGTVPAAAGAAPLEARPGDRVLVDLGDRHAETALLDALVGLAPIAAGEVCIGDADLATARHGSRRRLVAYAAQGLRFGRSAIATHALYRTPSAPRESADELLERAGLGPRVAALPRGAETVLRHGGDPLDLSERARLQLARALAGSPAVIVLERLDADLGPDGCRDAARLLRDFGGIVVAAVETPGALFEPTVRWTGTGAVPAPVALVSPGVTGCRGRGGSHTLGT